MNFTPLIIMNAILFVIAILLAIAERLLVTYGECKIILRQEDEEKDRRHEHHAARVRNQQPGPRPILVGDQRGQRGEDPHPEQDRALQGAPQ